MTLKIRSFASVPEDTARIARAVFPKGNEYLMLRNELGAMFEDEAFAPLFASCGRTGTSPAVLAYVTVLQHREKLTDRQAAEAVRSRIDWKYLLGLSLDDSGFDFSCLCRFRKRVLAGEVEKLFLDRVLQVADNAGLLSKVDTLRTDSTHVVAAVRQINRYELIFETLQRTLETLAELDVNWVISYIPSEWEKHYARNWSTCRLAKTPSERHALALQWGRDGWQVMDWIEQSAGTSPWMVQLPLIGQLRRVWLENFHMDDGELKFREKTDRPLATTRLASLTDEDARHGAKGQTHWLGYKVHLTEILTDGVEAPQLLCHIHTTVASESDQEALEPIHKGCEVRDLLPKEHLVDQGYSRASNLVDAETQYDVRLIAPVSEETSWQGRAGEGFDALSFVIDWEGQQATCPKGQTSNRWQQKVRVPYQTEFIVIGFPKATCQACPAVDKCTTAKATGRTLEVLPESLTRKLIEAREYQKTDEFKEKYKIRSGVEGTVSEWIRHGGRRASYRGIEKVHQGHVFRASALNINRISRFLQGASRSQTRPSHLHAALA